MLQHIILVLSCAGCHLSVGALILMLRKDLQLLLKRLIDYSCFDRVHCRLCFVLLQQTRMKIKVAQLLHSLVRSSADLVNEIDQPI